MASLATVVSCGYWTFRSRSVTTGMLFMHSEELRLRHCDQDYQQGKQNQRFAGKRHGHKSDANAGNWFQVKLRSCQLYAQLFRQAFANLSR